MSKIISVVPNICEGRDVKLIDMITEKLKHIAGLIVLDVSRDQERNRTVFSFTGEKKAIFEGGELLYDEAIKNIDMRKHDSIYPRIGAVDVFPFVPLKGYTIEEAIEMANEFAALVAEKFNLPIYLFGESANFRNRRDISHIREAGYEGMEERLKHPRWRPDYGPIVFRPDFGATIIGARYPLISFKATLNSTNMDVERKICTALERLKCVTAIPGVSLTERKVEMTVSISNYRLTPLHMVVEMIRSEAKHYGLSIHNIETIGLIPEYALIESALHYLGIREFNMERLLEGAIQKHMDEQLKI
jgi:glutamate formiminotransferase